MTYHSTTSDYGYLFEHIRDADREIVSVVVDLDDRVLTKALRTANAYWDARKKVWRLPFAVARKLGLEKCIV